MVTLRELYESLNISRRTVQGYEEEGLVKATKKNKNGYLLYDEEAVKRVAEIHFYQQIGFKRKEIKELIDASEDVWMKIMNDKIEQLKMNSNILNELISKTERMIQKRKER